MKKLLLAALAVTFGFLSCSKDGDSQSGGGDSKNAVLSVRFSADAFTKGAFDQIDDPATGMVQGAVSISGDIHVFAAQGGDIVLHQVVTPGDLTSNQTPTYTQANVGSESGKNLTTDVDQVIILANLPTVDFSTTTTVSQLQAFTKYLSDAQTDYLAGKIWVQGQSGVTWDAADTNGAVPGTASVSLHPVLSRIDAKVTLSDAVDTEATGIYASKSEFDSRTDTEKGGVVLESVSVLYSSKTSTWVAPYTPTNAPYVSSSAAPATDAYALVSGMVPAANTAWIQGKYGHAYELAKAVSNESFLFAEWNGTDWYSASNPNASGATSNYDNTPGRVFQRSFYAFSPKNYEVSTGGSHFISSTVDYKAYTTVTIKGTQYDKNGTAISPRYYSVVIAPTAVGGDTSEELEPGRRYLVNVTMKGDFANGNGGGGGTSPEEKGSANLTIEIKPAAWKSVITIDKDFGNN